MNMRHVSQELKQKAGCMKEIATFLDRAEGKDFSALKEALELFNNTEDDSGLACSAVPSLLRSFALGKDSSPEFAEAAEGLGCQCWLLTNWVSRHVEGVAALKMLSDLMKRIHMLKKRVAFDPDRTVLAVMREMVAEHQEPEASLNNLAESLDAAEPELTPEAAAAMAEAVAAFDRFKEVHGRGTVA